MKKRRKLPEKYSLRDLTKDDSLLINYEPSGWPIYKQTIRDVLIGLGLDFNEERNCWEINDDDPDLDCPVRILHDDGMGYGVDEKYVSCCDVIHSHDETFCNVFVEPRLDDIELWNEAIYFPGAWVTKKDCDEPNNSYCLRKVIKKGNKISYKADQYTEDVNLVKRNVKLNEEDIDWL